MTEMSSDFSYVALNAMLHTMPFCRRCHTVLNAMLHTMPCCIHCHVAYYAMLHVQCHIAYVMLHTMPCCIHCSVTQNAILYTLQCYIQGHIAYNVMLHTMSCYVQCHVSQNVMLAVASKEFICQHHQRFFVKFIYSILPCSSSQSLCFTCQKQKKVYTGRRKELFNVYLNLNIFRYSDKSTNRPKTRARETPRQRVYFARSLAEQNMCRTRARHVRERCVVQQAQISPQ